MGSGGVERCAAAPASVALRSAASTVSLVSLGWESLMLARKFPPSLSVLYPLVASLILNQFEACACTNWCG